MIYIPPRPDWAKDALCTGKTDLFYSDDSNPAKRQEAKAICADCKCRVQCLDYAITNHENYGIWGGMSAAQRARERMRRAS